MIDFITKAEIVVPRDRLKSLDQPSACCYVAGASDLIQLVGTIIELSLHFSLGADVVVVV